MKHAFRPLSLAATLGIAALAMAQQPYSVTITGTVSGCNANSYVHIVTLGGTQPTTEIDVPVLPPSCTFTVTLNMASQGGGFTISTPCNGAIQSQVVQYQVPPSSDSTAVSVLFNCGGSTADCLGIPGGTALPGTACTNLLNQPGTWNANCECVANAPDCQACLDLHPVINPNGNAIPFAVLAGNCSQGTAPITYQINWGDGVVNASSDHAYAAPGTYAVCITIADGSGCTSTACESVVIDANGTVVVDPSTPFDCLGIANGTALPGTPCTTWLGTPGIYALNCTCIPVGAAPPNDVCYNPTYVPVTANCLGTVGTLAEATPSMPGLDCGGPAAQQANDVWYYFIATSASTTVSATGGGSTTDGLDIALAIYPNDSCGNFGSVICSDLFSFGAQESITYNTTVGQAYYYRIYSANGAVPSTYSFTTCVTSGSITNTCQAGFWVIQAYEADPANPNGGVLPIPYELWVWNLSTGTSPFQFEWDFGDGTSSFDPYPTHVYGASGPYNLCLTMSDGAGCNSTYCDSVSIDGDGFYEGLAPGGGEIRTGFTIRVLNQLPMAVPEQRFNEARVWPNPVTDALNMSFRSTVSGSVPVRIIDLNGRVMHQDNLAFARGDNRINLSAAQLAPGLYVLRVGNDDQALNIRFIKQ